PVPLVVAVAWLLLIVLSVISKSSWPKIPPPRASALSAPSAFWVAVAVFPVTTDWFRVTGPVAWIPAPSANAVPEAAVSTVAALFATLTSFKASLELFSIAPPWAVVPDTGALPWTRDIPVNVTLLGDWTLNTLLLLAASMVS